MADSSNLFFPLFSIYRRDFQTDDKANKQKKTIVKFGQYSIAPTPQIGNILLYLFHKTKNTKTI